MMIPPELPIESTAKNSRFSVLPAAESKTARVLETAQRLEATFLSEMLKSAGFGMQSKTFSDGKEDDPFASFQRDAIAEHMVRTGGIGLAEHFFNAMMEAQNND